MEVKTVLGLSVSLVVGFIALGGALGSFYTVDQTERVVVLRNGAVSGTSGPGLHFKVPYIDDIVRVPVHTFNATWSGNNHLETYSKDLQNADIQLSVTWHVPDNQVEQMYSTYKSPQGMLDTLVAPRVVEQLKNVFGSYDAGTAINNRQKLNSDVQDAVKKAVIGPVFIDSIQITDVKFSGAFEQSVEQRMTAQIEVQKLEQNLAREKVQAQIVNTQADAAAYRVKAAGTAEAAAIKARSDALSNNPNLIALTAAEKWDGKLPSTMIPGGSVPFLNIPKQ